MYCSSTAKTKIFSKKSLQIPICRAIIAFAFGLWGLKSKAGVRYRWGISAVGRTNHQQLRPASSSSYRRICTKFGRDFWGISAVGRTNHQQLRPASSSSYRRICTKFGRDFWGISAVGSARHSHCRGQGFESPMLHTKPRHFALVFSLPTFFLKLHTESAGADSPTTGNKAYLFF